MATLSDLTRGPCVGMVVDIQEKLAAAMHEDVFALTLNNTRVLLQGLTALEVPCVVTEQYPKGLGPTVSQLQEVLADTPLPISKTSFDCCRAQGVPEFLETSGAASVVLVGMEAHICVLQTAQGLIDRGIHVFVAEDAVCSRKKEHWRSALRLMERAGAYVAPVETLLFVMLGGAQHESFRAVSRLIR